MKSYELVKDHKSGLSKVLVREERPPSDPFANESIRRFGIERRVKIASLKSWWVALRFSWRDRAQRHRIVGHAFFFLALLAAPVATFGLFIIQTLFAGATRTSFAGFLAVLAIFGLIGAALVLRSAVRKLFRR